MDGKIFVPPIKIQGIKTKLVPLIKQNVSLSPGTLWVEPFMGSGVVGFNVRPGCALFADINPHIINFYNAIKSGGINSDIVRAFLQDNGRMLEEGGEKFYYHVRERFNDTHSPLDFLFLNRSCFNGMIRFNREHKFNVPFGHKPHRFSKAYITKITNQVKYVEDCLKIYDWEFICQPFSDTIAMPEGDMFIYCDPPYSGRHNDYYDSWDERSELELCRCLQESEARFMLSIWDCDKYRENGSINTVWNFCRKISHEHFYHVGAKEANRHSMTEALLMNYPAATSITAGHQPSPVTFPA